MWARFLDVACPNEQCSQFGIAGKGNVTVYGTYQINSGKMRKYVCHICGTRFCDRTNTAFYDLRTRDEKVKQALKMAMRGMSVMGIAEILETKPSTISTWISKAAKHSEKVNDVVMKDVETPKVEMDEAWTFVGKKHFPEKMNTKMREPGSG